MGLSAVDNCVFPGYAHLISFRIYSSRSHQLLFLCLQKHVWVVIFLLDNWILVSDFIKCSKFVLVLICQYVQCNKTTTLAISSNAYISQPCASKAQITIAFLNCIE